MSAQFPNRPYVPRPSAIAIPPLSGRFVLLPPFVHGRAVVSHAIEQVAAEEEIPSIDDFLDHTPPIEQFAPTEPPANAGEWPSWGGEPSASEKIAGSEWAGTDWQGYDWRSAAQLGAVPADPADAEWASTDWSAPDMGKATRQSAAEALARALDQISRRIRAGELRVPGPETVQDDAAIAATLAALLGIRR